MPFRSDSVADLCPISGSNFSTHGQPPPQVATVSPKSPFVKLSGRIELVAEVSLRLKP